MGNLFFGILWYVIKFIMLAVTVIVAVFVGISLRKHTDKKKSINDKDTNITNE